MAFTRPRAEVYQRDDGRWAFRLLSRNGSIVMTDGNQGYENRRDAVNMLRRITSGAFADVDITTG